MNDVEELSVNELVELYSSILTELKSRGVLRSKNFLGDLGEYLSVSHYNSTSGLPNLQAAPPGTQNVDALSRKGEHYSIKATTGQVTGVFYGLNPPDSTDEEKQKFEFVIIAIFDREFVLQKIMEIDWSLFLLLKKWHKTARAWNLSINKELFEKGAIVYSRDDVS